MTSMRLRAIGAVVLGVVGACGGSEITPPPPPPPPGPPPGPTACASVVPLSLVVGSHAVVDPASSAGCVVLPASGASTTEYLVVAVSGSGQETTAGIQGPYLLNAGNVAAPAPTPSVISERPSRPNLQATFDGYLRARERELASRLQPEAQVMAQAPPPVVGDTRTFNACENLQCSSFVSVPATARYVGSHAAIYLDNTVPGTDTLQQSHIDDMGRTFDLFLYDIATVAFGAPSDLDVNGVVIILLTDQVNNLTPDCTNGRILGFFFGGDLLATSPGTNNGEIFYAFVPAPGTATCSAVSPQQATDRIKGTLIHEFQHMISWNQHVTLRSGLSEETWLNEALSHVSEELAGRQIPDAECPTASSCRSLYISDNLVNSYDYLSDTESHFMVFPESSGGTLEERGAVWLFLRWVIDQFANDPESLGANVTSPLVGTSLVGAANVQAVTGASFAQLVTEWQLANYLDDLPGFTPVSPRLRFNSWGFRDIFARNSPPNGNVFDRPFPMVPDLVTAPGSFTRSGSLRGGSGRTLRFVLPPNTGPTAIQVVRNSTGAPLDPTLVPRIGVARIR